MSTSENRGEYLESGEPSGLAPDERARLDDVRAVLADPVIWEVPPEAVADWIRTATVGSGSGYRSRWTWIAAALILIVSTVSVVLLTMDGPSSSAVATIPMAGTDLAREASGSAGLIPTPNGWAIDFEVSGLPPAELGTYYQAWVNNGVESVSVGSFHMRGDRPTSIGLWSGVDLHDYRTLNVTLQTEGEGELSSGILMMTGTAPEFDRSPDG
jgi:hypothetical protein